MKAVFWHADARHPAGIPIDDDYRRMIEDFCAHVAAWGIEPVHLTTCGHRRYTTQAYEYPFDPNEVMRSRERAFYSFLKDQASDSEVYWFTEPDSRIFREIPPLFTDCAMLVRDDAVPMCPGWRLATRAALPFFEELHDEVMAQEAADWHNDSAAFTKVYKRMGSPRCGSLVLHDKCWIEFRDYELYVKKRAGNPVVPYTRNYMGLKSKRELMMEIV